MAAIEILSVVALLEDLPKEGLVRGQVGTVFENCAPGAYEVEFCDDNGLTYAMVVLEAEQLMRLHHRPVRQPSDQAPTALSDAPVYNAAMPPVPESTRPLPPGW